MILKNTADFCRYSSFFSLVAAKRRSYCKECGASSISTRVLREKKQLRTTDKLIKTVSSQTTDKSFISRLRQNGYIYITDSECAKSVASYLTDSWKNGYIFEANPGPGILSKFILETGISHLRIFEKNREFLPELKELASYYPNLEIIPEDLMFLPSFDSGVPLGDLNDFDNFFSGIPELPWNSGVTFRLFSIISSKRSIKFFRYLLAILPTKASIFSYGRCEFYFLLKESEYKYMIATPKENFSTYRWSTVLYNVFFDVEFFEKFSYGSFYPLSLSRKKIKANSEMYFYLVKLTPKSDLFSSFSNCSKLPDLYFFVRHHLTKRSDLVIPTMEGWIPSCGPRLIKEGMSLITKFGDLSPNQILLLFNQFSSWPEYEDSTFHTALHRFYGKNSLSYEDDEKIL